MHTQLSQNCGRSQNGQSAAQLRLQCHVGGRRRADEMPRMSAPAGCRERPFPACALLCLLGALIGRCGEVEMEYPGGCVIGKRPIDLHLKALSSMGVQFFGGGRKAEGSAKQLTAHTLNCPFQALEPRKNSACSRCRKRRYMD